MNASDIVSIVLSSLTLAVGGLILFILDGIRSDVRDVREEQTCQQGKIEKLERTVAILFDRDRRKRLADYEAKGIISD